jgi:hypothetical protein
MTNIKLDDCNIENRDITYKLTFQRVISDSKEDAACIIKYGLKKIDNLIIYDSITVIPKNKLQQLFNPYYSVIAIVTLPNIPFIHRKKPFSYFVKYIELYDGNKMEKVHPESNIIQHIEP